MLDGIEASIDVINQRILHVLKTAHWSNQLVDELPGLRKAMDLLFELRDEKIDEYHKEQH